ncbi:MAG: ribosome-associated protein [Thermoleophilaceae bacterium]|jgi:ribosome-associated protein|nr:ribosome-associated protein [Thermoleophilaceae bacterium]MEA2369417.1 ribosome-associated protein [Thermoleophilaceae bacterium]MEA2387727.1 ribosome-associated protein [Thermoleophilaceae bacterium]
MESQVAIRGEMIRLGQLLKLAGLLQGGGEARAFLSENAVLVNGERETRRGRQVVIGDRVRVADQELEVVAS